MSRADAWTCFRQVSPEGSHVALLVATPVGSLSALALSPDEENILLREAWEAALEELPSISTGHRLSWRSFRFDCVAEPEEAVTAAHRLLARLTRGETGRTTWHLAVAAGVEADLLPLLEEEVAALAKRGSPSSVAVAPGTS